jgi:hypothetical protein
MCKDSGRGYMGKMKLRREELNIEQATMIGISNKEQEWEYRTKEQGMKN